MMKTTSDKMICPNCRVEMNHHCDRLVYASDSQGTARNGRRPRRSPGRVPHLSAVCRRCIPPCRALDVVASHCVEENPAAFLIPQTSPTTVETGQGLTKTVNRLIQSVIDPGRSRCLWPSVAPKSLILRACEISRFTSRWPFKCEC